MSYYDECRYDRMLNMPHHISKHRKHMTLEERAAQFGAFRALTGYEEAIAETGRLTDERIELDEYQKEQINLELIEISENPGRGERFAVTYFVPDDKKQGGAYVTHYGAIEKIRELEKKIIFADGLEVDINEVFTIEKAD